MTRRTKRLIEDPPTGLRERPRADGTVRIWWEPSTEARAKGMKPVELDAARLTWSVRRANELNREAAKGPPKPTAGRTVDHLIDDYTAGLAFRSRPATTQGSYHRFFRQIRTKWGPRLVADFDKPTMVTWYEALHDAKGPYMAMHLIRHFSILFAHAERRGWRPEGSNPCARLGIETPKGRRRALDWAEYDALVTAADRMGLPAIGDAIALSMLQGQRQTDVREARREQFHKVEDLWVWNFERSKRGNAAFAVLHGETVARLAPRLAIEEPGPLLVDDKTGQPWSETLFCHRFAAVREAAIKAGHASLRDVQFRDLRRTFGRLSRRGGATKGDVGDVLGNSAATNPYLGDVYMSPEVATALRAVLAIRRPEEEERKRA